MKYIEFNTDQNKIEFHNSILGKETILVDGKKVSEKFSITGKEHKFKIGKDNYKITSSYELFSNRMIKFSFEKNGKLIEERTVPMNSKQRIYWMGIGFLIGYLMFKMF